MMTKKAKLRKAKPKSAKQKPGVVLKATVYQEMPKEVAQLLSKENLTLKLDKITATKLFSPDQLQGMVAKDGCWSSPTGPHC